MENKPLETLHNFIKNYEEIEKIAETAFKAQSDLDKELSDWYHKVEGTKPSHVCQSHALIKEVKDILDRRRINKLDVIVFRITCDSLGGKIKDLKTKLNSSVVKHNTVLKELKTNNLT